MANLWHDVTPDRLKPDDFIAVIEIEKGSKSKYELDKSTGAIILDRVLYTSADDNDPLDVLVLCSEPILPMSLVQCYPIGVFTMLDQGKLDEKIIAIPFKDPNNNVYKDISELPEHMFREMSHFFSVYKTLEGKETIVGDPQGAEEAKEVIQKCLNAYIDKFCRG